MSTNEGQAQQVNRPPPVMRGIPPARRARFSKFQMPSREQLFKSIHFRVGLGYIVVAVCGITGFYFAKKDVNENRLKNMKVKDEIAKAETGLSDRFKHINEKNARFEQQELNLKRSS